MDEKLVTHSQENQNYTDWKKKTTLFLTSQSISLFGSMLVQFTIIWHITLTTQSGAILTIGNPIGRVCPR